MKKRNKFITYSILLYFIYLIYIIIKSNVHYDGGLEGNLLLSNPNGDNEFVIFNFELNTYTPIKLYSFYADFIDTEKILAGTINSISIFHINSSNEEIIYKEPEWKEKKIEDVRYIKDNMISYVWDKKIILMDIETKAKKIIVDDVFFSEHTWSKDGQTLYYTRFFNQDYSEIHKLNMETGTDEVILTGVEPSISDNEEIIAYRKGKWANEIIVKNLETGEEWTYDGAIISFCISPDGKYVAVRQEYNGINVSKFLNAILRVWDYENDTNEIIIDPVKSRMGNLNWIY